MQESGQDSAGLLDRRFSSRSWAVHQSTPNGCATPSSRLAGVPGRYCVGQPECYRGQRREPHRSSGTSSGGCRRSSSTNQPWCWLPRPEHPTPDSTQSRWFYRIGASTSFDSSLRRRWAYRRRGRRPSTTLPPSAQLGKPGFGHLIDPLANQRAGLFRMVRPGIEIFMAPCRLHCGIMIEEPETCR